MKKIYALALGLFLVGCSTSEIEMPAVGLSNQSPATSQDDQIKSNQTAPETQTLTIGEQSFAVEIADTATERQQGLMYRESMPANQGMLFVWADEAPRNFWMKNTLIPLDMVWINAAREIVDIKAAEPCRVADCPTYEGQAPAMYVLELNQGVLDAEVGDRVEF